MCILLMWSINPASMEDEYNCMTKMMPTGPKKSFESLSKIKKKLKDVQKDPKSEGRPKGKGQPDEKVVAPKNEN